MRSGFASLVGRPNVGKSTLLNRVLGTKVSIVSDKPQTTRTQVRGVLNIGEGDGEGRVQVVFVDTPGIHKPVTLLGEWLNRTATESMSDVDVAVLVLDATAPVGRGDRFVAARLPPSAICVLNKVDAASRSEVVAQLGAAGEFGFGDYFPVSAKTGEGVEALVTAIVARMPEGPAYYPDDMVTDVPESFWVAELVREQLLAVTEDELPYSIATRVTEWEERAGGGLYIRCEILVERESQKGMVIGRGGAVLKAAGTAVRSQLPPGAYLDLAVKVDKDWQRRPRALQRLGY